MRAASREVIANGQALVEAELIERVPGNWHVYEAQGSSGERYDVSLKGVRSSLGYTVVAARCTCKAGRNDTACKHIAGALLLARAAGQNIDLDSNTL